MENVLRKQDLRLLILAFVTIAQTSCSFISSSSDTLINNVSLAPPYALENPTTNQFHQILFVADLHAVTLSWERDLLDRRQRGHLDVPRMTDGNIALHSCSQFLRGCPQGEI